MAASSGRPGWGRILAKISLGFWHNFGGIDPYERSREITRYAFVEHKQQGLIYVFCSEERRIYLHNTYKTREDFINSQPEREEYFRSKYQHLKGGRKHTREEKIQYQVDLHLIEDDVLYDTYKPITKAIFLYENKNNQELKEFCIERNTVTENILTETLNRFSSLDRYVELNEVPPREGTKSSQVCRWCSYKNTCWIL